ncbi:MAG: hypothetical protein LAT55_12295 [Opitutales bacterium]|nr:hypothetical protein [Opitutales bacterium]
MKSLIVITLLSASLWSSFLYSAPGGYEYLSFTFWDGHLQRTVSWSNSPSSLIAPCSSTSCVSDYLATNLTVTWNDTNYGLKHCLSESKITLDSHSCSSNVRISYSGRWRGDLEPTNTCPDNEGGFLESRHNSPDPFCVHIGDTGGISPEPLLCMTREVAEVPAGSGSHIHEVTAQPCSAATGPVSPDGDGGDDGGGCQEDCGGDDDGGGSDDGGPSSGIPSTGGDSTVVQVHMGGTFTDSSGNITNVNLTMDNDFSPITVRQNETNQRLSAIQDQLHTGQQQTNQRLDGVISAIGGIGSGGGSDFDASGIESRLDAINDRFNDTGDSVDIDDFLPSYESHLEAMHQSVSGAISSGQFQDGVYQLENSMEGLDQGFSSFAQLWQFHNSNCSPIPFGNSELNFCGMAPTVSNVLTWVATVLTAIFIIHGVIALLLNVRLT